MSPEGWLTSAGISAVTNSAYQSPLGKKAIFVGDKVSECVN